MVIFLWRFGNVCLLVLAFLLFLSALKPETSLHEHAGTRKAKLQSTKCFKLQCGDFIMGTLTAVYGSGLVLGLVVWASRVGVGWVFEGCAVWVWVGFGVCTRHASGGLVLGLGPLLVCACALVGWFGVFEKSTKTFFFAG